MALAKVPDKGCRWGKRTYPDDLTGYRFGKLVVLSLLVAESTTKVKKWKCQCDCGNKTVVNRCNLTTQNGPTRSCGCIHAEAAERRFAEQSKDRPTMAMRRLLATYKHSAKRKGHEFLITEEEFFGLVQSNCHYCGMKPSRESRFRSESAYYESKFTAMTNGIDRVDNGGGYVSGNVVPCCCSCNLAKRDMSLSDFSDWLDRVSFNKVFSGWDVVAV